MQAAKFVVAGERSHGTIVSVFEPIISRITDGVNGSRLSHKLMKVSGKVSRINGNYVVFSMKDMEECDMHVC